MRYAYYHRQGIKANRQGIAIKMKSKNMCMLFDMAVPSDRNVVAKGLEKISKYRDFEIEFSKMQVTRGTQKDLSPRWQLEHWE